jgi:hypothetical protein
VRAIQRLDGVGTRPACFESDRGTSVISEARYSSNKVRIVLSLRRREL